MTTNGFHNHNSSPSFDDFLENDFSFSTTAIHFNQEPEQWLSNAVVPPICLASTYKQEAIADKRGFEYGKLGLYGRLGNPTRQCLEKVLAALEQSKYGFTFASGMAAVLSVVHILKAGDHVIVMDDIYSGTIVYFKRVASKFGLSIEFIDGTNLDNIQNAIKENTKMIWLETPTNPTLKLIDIKGVSKIAKNLPDCITVVDNTFLSPYFQRPLTLGADIVIHSCTKYLNGHSDVIMGAACTNNEKLAETLTFLQGSMGSIPSPFDCYLVLRSLKTLEVRMKKHMENGLKIATFLETHPYVEKVLHPGLPSHPQHELAKKQCYGHSGMVSFYIKGHNLKTSKKFFKNLNMFALAFSLGGFESLAEFPSVMTHGSLPEEVRERLGITDGLVRLSCGLEDPTDIISDLDQALREAFKS
ncbi:UNVERIFIED_CONTAM: hypothetical protein RMT77_000865 [Armadillidium vulgare]